MNFLPVELPGLLDAGVPFPQGTRQVGLRPEQAQQYLNLPASISNVFQGMLLFFLLAADLFITYRLRWSLPSFARRAWTLH